ncbi:TetR/AcrR family transcriptional regulator [Anaerosacchariphilus polymeriproducens]|uniref:TetR/AcrR family transcriptional regulator n=1 Tax=Anaerosacchariphilus polymeriproducens TaxID=1812858 RepID=A0A371ATC9_9FIRM|nr:TetR/AcrR family transcriptional regulator [Anaerosacchariphilus polymeriproducens]RDU22836.1 TetR/AcrR family transcriptional regulator [Anaerosacchariphilus polymeriproducens]
MNQKFFELPEEKRTRIINSAIEVFSQNDYKHASTDDMAAKAGISKGLLFYYFHNKKELYLYIYDYVGEYLKSKIMDSHYDDITDFFEILEYSAQVKVEILTNNPYIMDFAIRAFFSQNEEVSDNMKEIIKRDIDEAYGKYFTRIDYSKFKEDVDVPKVVQMLTWMADGYLHGKQLAKEPVTINEMMEEYCIWTDMFKKLIYKEEFL